MSQDKCPRCAAKARDAGVKIRGIGGDGTRGTPNAKILPVWEGDCGSRWTPESFNPSELCVTRHELQALRKQVAAAWQEGYEQGVADERTSEANIGLAGFGGKVNPARTNPYQGDKK